MIKLAIEAEGRIARDSRTQGRAADHLDSAAGRLRGPPSVITASAVRTLAFCWNVPHLSCNGAIHATCQACQACFLRPSTSDRSGSELPARLVIPEVPWRYYKIEQPQKDRMMNVKTYAFAVGISLIVSGAARAESRLASVMATGMAMPVEGPLVVSV
jgi:hypothetical protein